jgi:hypothetical protein
MGRGFTQINADKDGGLRPESENQKQRYLTGLTGLPG